MPSDQVNVEFSHLIWTNFSGPDNLQLSDGSTLSTTEDHPFWSITDEQFERTDELSEGELVLSANGEAIPVVGLDASVAHRGPASNLTIDGLHTYYVGVSEVLVHNAGCDEWAADFVRRAGGDVKTFESPLGRENGFLGEYRPGGPGTKAVDEAWGHHTVVVKDGLVFDQWHPEGVRIDEFKQMFDYGDVINFGF